MSPIFPRFIFNDDTTGVPPIEQESRRIFNGTDVKTVLNRTTFFVSVPLVILLAFSGIHETSLCRFYFNELCCLYTTQLYYKLYKV